MTQRPIGFYTDRERRVRPISQPQGVSRASLHRARQSTAFTYARKDANTLRNPLLYSNHKRWIRENVDPDTYDHIDWDAEIDPTLTPAESRDELKAKYPDVFIEKGPSRSEVAQMKRERMEFERLYKEYEASFEKEKPTPETKKVARRIKARMVKLPPQRRERILREKPRLRREPLLREIVIKTKSGRSYTRTKKVWRY